MGAAPVRKGWPRRGALRADGVLLALSFIAAAGQGADAISPAERWQVVLNVATGTVGSTSPEHLVFVNIRLPRLLLGVPVERVTATTGISGFVGLMAPHGVRLLAGPDHCAVLPSSALLGAALVLLADSVARTAVQPAELPLGMLTTFVGVPFFLLLLRHFKSRL